MKRDTDPLRTIKEPSLRTNIKNKTLFKDFRTGKSKQQVAEEVQEAKPSKFKKAVQKKSEKVLIITDSQGRVFEESIKAEYRAIVDYVMISRLTSDQGKKENKSAKFSRFVPKSGPERLNVLSGYRRGQTLAKAIWQIYVI